MKDGAVLKAIRDANGCVTLVGLLGEEFTCGCCRRTLSLCSHAGGVHVLREGESREHVQVCTDCLAEAEK